MEAEHYADACPKFEESLRLDNGMGTQFNLAHCWEKLGRTASAWALFLDVAAAARAGNQTQREVAARERAKSLEPKLTRMRIQVSDPAPGTQVVRDGQEVGKAAWGTGVPIDPGQHVVRVTAPGKEDWSNEVDVPATSRTFTVAVPALKDAPIAPPQVQPEPAPLHTPPVEADVQAPSSGGSNGQKLTALVVGGAGVAVAAVGTIFAIQSRSDNAAALELCRVPTSVEGRTECASPAEQERHQKLIDAAKRERSFGFIGIGAGSAALITAIILMVSADGDSGPREAAFELAPLWANGVQGAAISGHF
jgi:hypothetical protein